jgi:predicted Holliday junction resolvase-like endonuclease
VGLLLPDFLREQRHIFGVCPECHEVSRLTDIQISYKVRYVPDWLETLEREESQLEGRKERLEERAKEIRLRTLETTRRKLLPLKLKAVSPVFKKARVMPQDVKVLLHPIDYVCFDGLYSQDILRKIVFLDSKPMTNLERRVQTSISRAIARSALEWTTMRVGNDGRISLE